MALVVRILGTNNIVVEDGNRSDDASEPSREKCLKAVTGSEGKARSWPLDGSMKTLPKGLSHIIGDAFDIMLLRSKARHDTGDFVGACSDATTALELDGIDAKMKVKALNRRGFSYEAMGDMNSAYEDAHRARQIWERIMTQKVGTFGLRVKFKKLLRNFEDSIERLKSWVNVRGYLPWAKGQTLEERQLAQWVKFMRVNRLKLPVNMEAKLEGVRGWSWEGRPSAEPLSSSESSDESTSPLRRSKKRPFIDSDDDQSAEEDFKSKWLRETQDKIILDLAKASDSVSRRLCLRRWQLLYHPDKNPERVDEVMPIFRWVMSLWNREQRASGHCEIFAKACDGDRRTTDKQAHSTISSRANWQRQEGGLLALTNSSLHQKLLRGVRIRWKERKRLRCKQSIETNDTKAIVLTRRLLWKQPAGNYTSISSRRRHGKQPP